MASTYRFVAALLVTGLASPALGQTGPLSTSPFRQSIAREAWLAGQTATALPATARWSRVRSLRSGERIHVTLSNGLTLERSFLAADDAIITVLNESNPLLPVETIRDLRRVATTNPRALVILRTGGTLRLDQLRIDPRGVFLDNKRVGEVSSIVEPHRRDDVAEISLANWREPKRFWRYLLGWPGALGLSAGVGVAGYACETRTPCSVSDRVLAVSGAAGALATAFLARHVDRRTPDGIVYRRQSGPGT